MTRRSRIPSTRRRDVLYVLPSIPDDADVATKNAIATRNTCMTQGRCPGCGAVGEVRPDPKYGRAVLHLVFSHEPTCPAFLDAA